MKLKEFIDNYCTACGGNWTSMLMSGIQKLDPIFYEAMEDKEYDFDEIYALIGERYLDKEAE